MSRALRLAYVSPLPPVRSGISDYSVDLLESIRQADPPELDLAVLRVPGQEIAPHLVERYQPLAVDALRPDGAAASHTPWFQMGNNPYHAEIGDLARERPGILTLHDVWLHHLLIEQTLAQGDPSAYVDRLVQEHGWMGGAVALPPRWSGYSQAALFALPAHRTLLEAQKGVLVHSDWAARLLAEEGVRAPVSVVPMPMPSPPLSDELRAEAVSTRQRLNIPLDTLLLGSFGFQTPIKRTLSVVRALAHPGLEDAHLLVAGEVSPTVDLRETAREAGVSSRVHEVGFLNEEEFQIAIEACDLCVNLRYPTAGETSASLLRTFARGRAAVVSDYAQFADFSDAVVLKVPVAEAEKEAADLAGALGPLVRNRALIDEMGSNARRLIEEQHDPVASALTMLEAIRDFEDRTDFASESADSNGHAAVEVPTPTSRTWGELPSVVEVFGTEDWAPGERRELKIELSNCGFASFLPAEDGSGGVAVALELLVDGEDLLQGTPWIPLPRTLNPGESCTLNVKVRRPPGRARLHVEPQVLGGEGFKVLGGAFWEREI